MTSARSRQSVPRSSLHSAPTPGHGPLARIGPANRVIAVVTLVTAVCLIPWIVFLGFSLPPHYDAGHWPLLWIGYDVAEMTVLAFAAWAAWFRREVLAPACLVVAVLLLCDAWFDVVTSWGHRDQWVTLATGLGAEIPLGIVFLWIYRLLVLKALAAFHESVHDGIVVSHLVDAPLLVPEEGGDQERQKLPIGWHLVVQSRARAVTPRHL